MEPLLGYAVGENADTINDLYKYASYEVRF
jgi:hypothetical protein